MAARIRDIPSACASPVRFFQQFDLASTYGGPLLLLLLMLALAGYAVVASGLVEREVDAATERNLARIEKISVGEMTREQLDEQLKIERQSAAFWKVIESGAVVLRGPLEVIGRIFIGAAVIYVAVALSGRKPAYHGLVAILTFAAYTEIFRQAVAVPLMLSLGSTDVDTSLSVLVRARAEVSGWQYSALHAVDPFEIWFYVLAAVGVSRAGQLSPRGAVVACTLLWLGTASLRAGADFLASLPETLFAA